MMQPIEVFRGAGPSDRPALLFSVWFGVGFLPKVPGTFATLTAVPLVLILDRIEILSRVVFLAVFVILAVLSSGVAERLLEKKDPREIVIDEVAGFLITVFLLPPSWPILLGGFTLFRFFDIVKWPLIRRLEGMRGGAGIVLDDLVAGIYANLVLRVALFLAGR